MVPSIGQISSIPSYFPGAGGTVTEVLPLEGEYATSPTIKDVSPEVLAAWVDYHHAKISHLHQKAFYLLGDFLKLAKEKSSSREIKEKLRVFRYLCEKAAELLAERPVLIDAVRQEQVQKSVQGRAIAAQLWKSAVEWTGMIAVSMAVDGVLKKHLAVLLEEAASRIEAQLLKREKTASIIEQAEEKLNAVSVCCR